MIPRAIGGGGNTTSIGVAFVFGALGYVLTTSIWFGLVFGLLSFGFVSLLGYRAYSPKGMCIVILSSFLLTSFVLYNFEQHAVFSDWFKVGGESILQIGNVNIGGETALLSFLSSEPVEDIPSEGMLDGVTTTILVPTTSLTTTTLMVVNEVEESIKYCGIDCSIFNGDFEFVCDTTSGLCEKRKCEVDGDCGFGYSCKFKICSR